MVNVESDELNSSDLLCLWSVSQFKEKHPTTYKVVRISSIIFGSMLFVGGFIEIGPLGIVSPLILGDSIFWLLGKVGATYWGFVLMYTAIHIDYLREKYFNLCPLSREPDYFAMNGSV